ncbi:zinc-dependent alcohol dehydrogenase [Halomicrobium urmianum]|uniref:zinc-dependent alcohol dehydrogenase n=1 Tax=Halomicrobium urmianum TaxID=1586233 RepID=UPI001CDA1FAB|nr:zinc-binding alcohol dehydrogenase [Halomicrobium urmianum]
MADSNPTLVFPAERTVELQDRERPDPADDEVLIETDTTMVSTGTEITVLSGDYPPESFWDDYGEYPFVTGYTNVGTVVEAGADAELDEGTRVASWTPHAASVTAAADECIPVPDDVSDAEAVPFAIAQIVANGLRRGRVDWGETVVVYGLGILGQLAVRLAHLAGVERVIGVDRSENRLSYLPSEPGITGVDAVDTDPAEAVADLTDGAMADVVVEVTGNPDAIPDEFDVLRDQGRMVLLSSPHGETTLDFHDYVNAPSYEIIGAHQTSHPEYATPADPWTKERHADLFFTYQRQGRLDVDPLYSHVRDYEDAPELYRELLEDRTRAMGVRLEW